LIINESERVRGALREMGFDTLSVDELWVLHQEIVSTLASRLRSEKRALEKRLQLLKVTTSVARPTDRKKRRAYPTVFPKYQNPDRPAETWSGRGKQPRWLAAHLKAGKAIDDFRIQAQHYSRGAV
jgi:DNA-binding protein H-NS